MDKFRCETSRRCAGPRPGFVPVGLTRAQPRRWGKHRYYVRKGSRQRGCAVECHRRVPFFRVPERAKCCPFFKYGEHSAVGETVPSAAPGTRLRRRARCSGYSVGRRSPLEPATRKGSPGVEFSTALLLTDGRKISRSGLSRARALSPSRPLARSLARSLARALSRSLALSLARSHSRSLCLLYTSDAADE